MQDIKAIEALNRLPVRYHRAGKKLHLLHFQALPLLLHAANRFCFLRADPTLKIDS